VWACYGFLGLMVFGYFVSLLVRGAGVDWTWLDGWTVAGIELAATALCARRALHGSTRSAIPVVLALALLAWSLGDVALTAETLGNAAAPSVSIADAFYLCFYPLAYVATVLLLRANVGRLSKPNWLDGFIVGLGASALCAAFAFHSIVHDSARSALSAAVNLSYPIGDVLLLFLVVGGSTMLGRGRRISWWLLALGIGANVLGDTSNLFQGSLGSTALGLDANALAWPLAIVLMSMSVWFPPPERSPFDEPRTSGFVLPGLAALVGLALLCVGTQRHVGTTALALALATLLAIGIRFGLSARDLRNVTEQRHRLAMTDELTGLGNRRRLTQVLESFFGGNEDGTELSKMAFLFVDLNHFKEINDSFGHPAGDELLRQVGPRLAAAVRTSDAVMRMGGDEFGIVLLDADEADAVAVAERVADSLLETFPIKEVAARVGVSIGIALCPSDATDATGLLWCADVAMYRAKLGNTPFARYDNELDGRDEQLKMVDELRHAVEHGELVVHFQPQLDLRTGRVVAVEALVRWPHPTHGLIPPLKFLPLAEDAGLMHALTLLVLDRSIAQCATWRSQGCELSISVNITVANLLSDGFTELIEELLDRHHIDGSALILELTETSVVSDFEGSQSVIGRLRDLGVEVSIDDFGAGATSLAYLSALAVRELKLDRSLILGMGGAEGARELELVRATIELGHAMGLRVVAEGIEDEATLELLRELGCDLAQGFLISRPMPAGELSFSHRLLSSPVSG
jgi:diguanylate cyclase (GGDEF)-like protein